MEKSEFSISTSVNGVSTNGSINSIFVDDDSFFEIISRSRDYPDSFVTFKYEEKAIAYIKLRYSSISRTGQLNIFRHSEENGIVRDRQVGYINLPSTSGIEKTVSLFPSSHAKSYKTEIVLSGGQSGVANSVTSVKFFFIEIHFTDDSLVRVQCDGKIRLATIDYFSPFRCFLNDKKEVNFFIVPKKHVAASQLRVKLPDSDALENYKKEFEFSFDDNIASFARLLP